MSKIREIKISPPASRPEIMEALRTALEWVTISEYENIYITLEKGWFSVTISADSSK